MLQIGDKIRYKRLDGEFVDGIIIETDVFDKDAYFYKVKATKWPSFNLWYYKKALDEAFEKGEIEIVINGLQKIKKRLGGAQ